MVPALVGQSRDHWLVVIPFEGCIFRALGSGHVRVTLLGKGPSHFNAYERGRGRVLRARLFKRRSRARSGRRGQADVTARRGSSVAGP
jgi:hypothetical protein